MQWVEAVLVVVVVVEQGKRLPGHLTHRDVVQEL
jgi:hypothetical protein